MTTLGWTKHVGSGNLACATAFGLYSISRGGEDRKQYILRFLPLSSKNPAAVLGIHDEVIHAKDEADKHHLNLMEQKQ